MSVTSQDRYRKGRNVCPICGGAEDYPPHHKRRCTGFQSKDGEWARCSREEHAGASPLDDKCTPPVYVHKLKGACRCGDTHGEDNRPRFVKHEPSNVYEYQDENGTPLYRKLRFRQPDAKFPFLWEHAGPNGWAPKRPAGMPLFPYRYRELLQGGGVVYVCEGERDVETLRAQGFTATCNPDGAGPGKWRAVADLISKAVAGRDVIILSDADKAGRPHAREVFDVIRGVVKTVVTYEPTKGKDITDHLNVGGTMADLIPIKSDDVSFQEPPPEMCDDEAAPPPKQDIHVAPEAEAHIVAAMMASRDCLAATELIGPADFSDQRLATIFGGCLEAREAGRAADPVTVATLLRSHGHLDAVGGLDRLVMMANAVAVQEPRADEIRGLSEILRTRALERKAVALVQEGAAAIASANGTTLSVAASLSMALTRLAEARVDRPKFEYITAADMLSEDAPLTYLVEHLGLVDGGGPPHMIAGAGYSGKTMICQDMALSLASGRHVWGAYEPGKPCFRVLHVDLEQGAKLTKLRYRRLAHARGVDLREVGDFLKAVVYPKGLRLVADQWSRWRDLMGDRDVMFLDSQRVAAAGLDENSSEFRESLDMIGGLSNETRCRVIVIHHLRKESKDGGALLQELIRGSSAIFEALDCCLLLKKRDNEDVTVHQVKARSHGENAEPFSATISDVAGPDGQRKWGLRVAVAGMERVEEQRQTALDAERAKEQRSIEKQIRYSLQAAPGQTAEEIALRIHRRPNDVRRALLTMTEIASSESEPGARGGRPKCLYRLQ